MHRLRSGFWNSVVTVLLGATGAQLLPILAAPLLTRLCTPAELGGFSVWLGVIAVTSIAAGIAWVLDVAALRAMSWFGLLTIGIGTWLTACMQTTLAYAVSHPLFGKAAQAKILQAGAIAASQLALLYAGLDGVALLAGQLIGLDAGL